MRVDEDDPENEDLISEDPGELVLHAMRTLNATIANLASQVAREHDRAKAREAVIDRLHAEALELRAGAGRQLLRPVLTDLLRLRDELLGQARSVPAAMSDGSITVLLESYADSVVMILERYGVTVARQQPGEPFDPRRHSAAGTTAASERELDGLIATVLNDGYQDADTGVIIAPARVIVYRHAGTEGSDGQGG